MTWISGWEQLQVAALESKATEGPYSVSIVSMQCLCSVSVVSLQCLCSVPVQSLQCPCSVSVVSLQCLCSVSVVSLQCLQCLCSVCSVSVVSLQCLQWVCSVPIVPVVSVVQWTDLRPPLSSARCPGSLHYCSVQQSSTLEQYYTTVVQCCLALVALHYSSVVQCCSSSTTLHHARVRVSVTWITLNTDHCTTIGYSIVQCNTSLLQCNISLL